MVMSNGLFQSIENLETGERVEEALSEFDPVRFQSVSAVVFFGIVELSGIVANYYDKAVAMGIARSVPGVTTVVESLQIRQPNGRTPIQSHWRPRPIPFYRNLTEDRVAGRFSSLNE